MKTISLFHKVLLIAAFLTSSVANTFAQNDTILYGTTSQGGDDGGGVIFHINPNTGIQTVDYSFPILYEGSSPKGELTYYGNGKFYGMTMTGGKFNMGIIFEWDSASNATFLKYEFTVGAINGKLPESSLSLFNGKLYGMTPFGGTHSAGIIFEFDPLTNAFIKKIDLDSISMGALPTSYLVLNGGKFYGTTSFGGINNVGTIFEWDPITNAFSKKFDFTEVNTGYNPKGALSFFNGKFYGMTLNGGLNNMGVIFEWDPIFNIYTKKIDLDGVSKGSYPTGTLSLYNGKLYGITNYGGSNNMGVIFEWDPTSNVYIKKIDLDGLIRGKWPKGSLVPDQGVFYGMTYAGGSNDLGTLFTWNPNDNNFTKVLDFNGTDNGSNPWGSLISQSGKLIGMTYLGGKNRLGLIFEWDPANSIYSKKIDFNSSVMGSGPCPLILVNGKLIGMTSTGGTYGDGAIFEWDPATNTLTKRRDFNSNLNGSGPRGTLAYLNSKYYGTTYQGGSFDMGTIFEWDPITDSITKKIDFDNLAKGKYPNGNLLLFESKFYGLTYSGGYNNLGVYYSWDPVSNIYSKLMDFTGSGTGSNPVDGLSLYNEKYYGVTFYGGANGKGVIFQIKPSFIKKIDFNGNDRGSYPSSSLTIYDDKFYGVAYSGGANNKGLIYEWNPLTNVFAKRIDFDGLLKGSSPYGALTFNNGRFYGMTNSGGTNNMGIVYEWDPSSANTFTKLFDFNTDNGAHPGSSHFTTYYDSTFSAQASSIVSTNVQSNQITIDWINGYGSQRAVFVKQGNEGTATPMNNTTYTANTAFGSGTQIGTSGWYCVYNGNQRTTGVTITNLSPSTCYRIMVCEYTGSAGSEQYNVSAGTGNPANFTTLSGTCTVTATANPSAGGTTTGSGTYASSSIASVIATPNAGWNFVNWTISGTPVSTDSVYSFIVTADVDLVAYFLPDQVTVTTISNPVSGGITIGAGTYNYGNQVTVTALTGTGWNFINWTENGNIVSTDSAFTFTATDNTTLIANFVIEQYNVSTSSNPASGGATTGSGTYNYGDPATVSATPNSSWVFLNWTENGNVVSTSPQFTFTITGNRTLTANFTQLPTYVITTTALPAAGGSTLGGGNYLSGDTAVVIAIPNTGYHFINWTENNTVITNDSIYSFMVISNRNLTANFELQQFNISTTPVPAEGGTTFGDGTYTYGTNVTVTASVNSGWEFDHWEENGAVVSINASYNFVVTSNKNLSAVFYQQGAQYIITASSNPAEGGNTSGAGTYIAGTVVTLTATVNPGWEFTHWAEGGTEVSTDSVYTFLAIGDRDLTANFLQQFLITATASPLYAGYTIGSGEYLSGQEVTLNAVANLGWELDRWTENGIQVSDTSVYTFIATDNLDLLAEFVPVAGILQQVNNGFYIYPNPVSNHLYIAWDTKRTQSFDEVMLFNTLLKVVYHQPVDEISGLLSIPVRNLEPGLYYVVLRSRGERLFSSTVIIQK